MHDWLTADYRQPGLVSERLREVAANVEELEQAGALAVARDRLLILYGAAVIDLEGVAAELGRRARAWGRVAVG